MTTFTAENIFESFFRPFYPKEAQESAEVLAVLRKTDINPAKNPQITLQLREIAETFQALAPEMLSNPDIAFDFSDMSIEVLDQQLTSARRDQWMKQGDGMPALTQWTIHAAVYIGETIVRAHHGEWSVRMPLWESQVRLKSQRGEGYLSPFHWLLKSLSDQEIGKGRLTARYREYVTRATMDPSQFPVFIHERTSRKLPTLGIVRYDTLHKYLRAHVAELRDLGRDFPSAEEFDNLRFLDLDFMILGEGRMLLMHGRNKHGLHLFWFDSRGFSHAMFFPANPADAHSISQNGNKLIVTHQLESRTVSHEMLWWG